MKIFKAGLLVVGIATAGLFAFRSIDTGSIRGTVIPADGATKAWALSSSDTLKGVIQSGSFEIVNVKPGTYRLIIEAKPPYKNTAKDNVVVADGQPTNVGEIKLGQ
ncbi:MAG: carboxypeptidase regulatory-like domain-containing protein [Bacteroidota bacterium]